MIYLTFSWRVSTARIPRIEISDVEGDGRWRWDAANLCWQLAEELKQYSKLLWKISDTESDEKYFWHIKYLWTDAPVWILIGEPSFSFFLFSSFNLKISMTSQLPTHLPSTLETSITSANSIVGVHYRVGKKLGEGSFGVLYEGMSVWSFVKPFMVWLIGTDLLNGNSVAVKFEPRSTDAPQLRDEYKTYKILAGIRNIYLLLVENLSLNREFIDGIPAVHYFGHEKTHSILVMDLLGPSLEELFDMCGRVFSVKTVAMIAKQMVQ